jgi:D-sedoheptulose 7-phosphate isomerase
MSSIKKSIIGSIETKLKIVSDDRFIAELERIGNYMVACLRRNRKIMIAGNGGSAADAQHFVAELAGKFIHDRRGLPAIALTTNSSIVTAIGNDFGYENVFSRQVDGLGREGDIFVGISTSGNSENLVRALEIAKKNGLITVGLLGRDGGPMKDLCDLKLIVPSHSTQYIQEAHIMLVHQICTIIDDAFKNHI